jgi:hypothetical protein
MGNIMLLKSINRILGMGILSSEESDNIKSVQFYPVLFS